MSTTATVPDTLDVELQPGNIPKVMRERRQWFVWRGDKKPRQVNGNLASSTDPSTWCSIELALDAVRNDGFDGIGFVFTSDDPFTGIDLDHCRDADTGKLDTKAAAIVERLASYTEVSQSGTGVHVIVEGTLPNCDGKRKGNVEAYSSRRCFITTGSRLDKTPDTIQPCDLTAFYREHFGEPGDNGRPTTQKTAAGSSAKYADADVLTWVQTEECELWDGDCTRFGSQSEADLALCNRLAFRCGLGAEEQVVRLFRQSGLGQRPKAQRDDYVRRTVETAYRDCLKFYDPKASPKYDYNRTDVGNAERLRDRHRGKFFYVGRWKKWVVWDGKRYRIDFDAKVEQLAVETVRHMFGDVKNLHNADTRDKYVKHILRSDTATGIRNMLYCVQHMAPLDPSELDTRPFLFNTTNGTVDLETGRLRPHRKDDRITKLASVVYDPDAGCSTWLRFLDVIFEGDIELITFVQRVIGYSLTGDVSEQQFYLLYGTGSNGKSTLVQTVLTMLGDYATQTPAETLLVKRNDTASNDLAALRGARFVAACETEDGKRLAESLVKRMTGGDSITARFLYGEFFTFDPEFKLALATNHKPSVGGTDHALWRRIKLIPFTVTIPDAEQDRRLTTKLRRELSGILAWSVRGCLDWQRDGLKAPEAVTDATARYRTDSDDIGQWIDQTCDTGPECQGQPQELWRQYTKDTGDKYMTAKRFYSLMDERGFERCGAGGGRRWYYRGVRLPAGLSDA